jgi:hypothetical protein
MECGDSSIQRAGVQGMDKNQNIERVEDIHGHEPHKDPVLCRKPCSVADSRGRIEKLMIVESFNAPAI